MQRSRGRGKSHDIVRLRWLHEAVAIVCVCVLVWNVVAGAAWKASVGFAQRNQSQADGHGGCKGAPSSFESRASSPPPFPLGEG